MCGIAGIISKTTIIDEDINSLNCMVNGLIHRGPDSQGNFFANNLIMSMRRLSIIDLDGGSQPLYNEDESIVLIANGEVYNYKELVEDLRTKNHVFRTNSDCEVIIHLYEEYGEEFVHYLRGMYAFCLYDIKKEIVYIIRDRMGEKPLYYYKTNENFLFSSEMKSILSSKKIPFILNETAIYDYFHFQFIPEPETAIKSVMKLESGHYLKINIKEFSFDLVKYWDMTSSPELVGDPIQLVRDELLEIGKLTVRSDVKIGIALSGGLDSSAIATLSKKFYSDQIIGFTIGYPGKPPYDEREDAKILASSIKMPLIEVELETQDLVENFSKMNFDRDDPIADISGFGYWAISRSANKNGIKVLLQGQGGDEMFWGYDWVRKAVEETDLSRKRTNIVFQFIKLWMAQLPRNGYKDWLRWLISFTRIRGCVRKLKIYKNSKSQCVFYELTPDYQYTEKNKNRLFSKSFLNTVSNHFPLKRFPIENNLSSDILIMKYISNTYLKENGISQGDRLSMAHSVELRLPFVDYRLVENLVGIRKNNNNKPDYLKFPKPYLREAMKEILPSEIIERPKKGFSPPVKEWHIALFEKFGHQLQDGILKKSGILSSEGLDACIRGEFPDGCISPFSFKALVFENWARQMKELTI